VVLGYDRGSLPLEKKEKKGKKVVHKTTKSKYSSFFFFSNLGLTKPKRISAIACPPSRAGR